MKKYRIIVAVILVAFLIYSDEGGKGWKNFMTLGIGDLIAIIGYFFLIYLLLSILVFIVRKINTAKI